MYYMVQYRYRKKRCAQVIGTSVRAPGVRRHQRVCGNQCGCQRWAIHNGVGLFLWLPEGCTATMTARRRRSLCGLWWRNLPDFFILEDRTMTKKRAQNNAPRCPYCGSHSILKSADGIYRRNDQNTMLYVCSRFPACDSYVRVHPGTKIPMGTMANRELRALRNEAHRNFDQLHKRGC